VGVSDPTVCSEAKRRHYGVLMGICYLWSSPQHQTNDMYTISDIIVSVCNSITRMMISGWAHLRNTQYRYILTQCATTGNLLSACFSGSKQKHKHMA
jgi:hypothetical protein